MIEPTIKTEERIKAQAQIEDKILASIKIKPGHKLFTLNTETMVAGEVTYRKKSYKVDLHNADVTDHHSVTFKKNHLYAPGLNLKNALKRLDYVYRNKFISIAQEMQQSSRSLLMRLAKSGFESKEYLKTMYPEDWKVPKYRKDLVYHYCQWAEGKIIITGRMPQYYFENTLNEFLTTKNY